MFSVVQMSLMTYLVTYLHDELVFTLVGAGLAMTLTQFGGVIGRVLWEEFFNNRDWPVASAVAILLLLLLVGPIMLYQRAQQAAGGAHR
jgi:ABC-type spermidine/putrescine transport system permease subunit I